MYLLSLLLLSSALSLIICYLIVRTKDWHSGLSARTSELSAVQGMHVAPTPRIGGVAIFASVGLSCMALPGAMPELGTFILLSTAPVFLVGLAEDLTRRVSAASRYVAAVGSSALAIIFSNIWINGFDVPAIGYIFSIMPIGVALTLFVTSSYSHSFNLIDGLNGLASGVAVISASALIFLCIKLGDTGLALFLTVFAGAIMGFMPMNFPNGRLFLGDAGAYGIGHVLIWCGLVLYSSTPDLSAFSMLLIFFWPLADTLMSIFRRLKIGKSFSEPDKMHFHHVTMRAIEITLLGRGVRQKANPIATAVILPLTTLPVLLGVVFWNSPVTAFVSLCACGFFYVVIYSSIIHVSRKRVEAFAARYIRA